MQFFSISYFSKGSVKITCLMCNFSKTNFQKKLKRDRAKDFSPVFTNIFFKFFWMENYVTEKYSTVVFLRFTVFVEFSLLCTKQVKGNPYKNGGTSSLGTLKFNFYIGCHQNQTVSSFALVA